MLIRSFLSFAVLAASASAQLTQSTGTPPNAVHTLDFDAPFVSSGAIAGNSSVFTANGIAAIALVGTWTVGGDTITAASNGSGQTLVSTGGGAGLLSVAGVNEALDNSAAGGGFEITLQVPAKNFGALFVDQINFNYSVEVFSGASSVGVGSFSYSGAFPAPAHYWTSVTAFDRIRITTPAANGGWGIDNISFDNAAPPAPSNFCTAGTTTNGCTATMSATGNPSVSFATPCSVSINALEGQKTGIIFYGLAANPQPWCISGSSTSFLCVKLPTQRTVGANSGGTIGQCDGSITLDWNLFQQTYPTALGNPFPIGAKVYTQGWFRDPTACKTTNLSDGLELTCLP